MRTDPTYQPPMNREELLQRYEQGERNFPGSDLCDANLSGLTFDGANFEPFSWFHGADFTDASLCGTSFRSCNVKCATFRRADLTGATFNEAAIEAIELDGAKLLGTTFIGATFYGYTLGPSDQFP